MLFGVPSQKERSVEKVRLRLGTVVYRLDPNPYSPKTVQKGEGLFGSLVSPVFEQYFLLNRSYFFFFLHHTSYDIRKMLVVERESPWYHQ